MAERRPSDDPTATIRLRRRCVGGARVLRPVAGAVAGLAIALLGLVGSPRAVGAQQLPEGVTQATVDRGQRLYHGDGFCYNCHGRDGQGIPDIGSDLGDDTWRHVDGSLEGLVRLIRDGISAEQSSSGIPMPPKGGAHLSPDQIRAVAAYVWTLSHGGPGGRR